jgi:cell division cycle protein 37
MQEAFVAQDVQTLKDLMSEMDAGEADYHLRRCIDAGLWVVPPAAAGEDSD